MASINQVVSEICHTLGHPNNHSLRENVRNSVCHIRNEIIRQSYTNHNYIDKGLKYRVKVSLIDVPDGDLELPFDIDTELITYIKRTEQKVPRPVRLTNNLPFHRISTSGYKNNIVIPVVSESTFRFMGNLPGMNGTCGYDYINDYIYIFPSKCNKLSNLNNIVIETVFESPQKVVEINEDIDTEFYELYGDDCEWAISEDMIGMIKNIIYKRDLLTQVHETNEVSGAQTIK